jgi:adenosylmethionine-8-amino-7-oxononanoate aminotransferase
MALQYWSNKGVKKKKLVALQNAYHGDTFGAMSVSGRSVFTDAFTDYLFDVSFIPFPQNGGAESVAALEALLKAGDVAAFIVEPLVQGSAGMRMYSAQILEQYFKLCRQYNTLIIADEVMTGFCRTGPFFACHHIHSSPDIVCLSKGLTGGTMAMGVTACTHEIFDAFYGDDRTKMLYHGHSYTANPVACAAALASLELLMEESCTLSIKRIAAAHETFAGSIAGHPAVADIRQTGTIIAIELKTNASSYHSALRDEMYRFFLSKNIILRPLGNVIYILPPYCITEEELNYVYRSITEFLAHDMLR